MRKIFFIFVCCMFFLNTVSGFSVFNSGSFDSDVEVVTSAIVNNVFNSGSFDSDVIVRSPPVAGSMVVNSSGSFDSDVYIEYYVFMDWSDWWVMVYSGNIGISNFSAISFNTSVINLSWDKTVNTTHTYIRRSTSGYPLSITDGVFVVNTTDSSFNDTNLNTGTLYYYSAWAYNNVSNVFSNTKYTSVNYTKPGDGLDFLVTGSTMNSVSLSWSNGINASRGVVVMNETGYANYPVTPNNGTVKYNNTGTSKTVTGLVSNVTYYFSLWSYIPDDEIVDVGHFSMGYVSINGSTVASAGAPTNFIATRINHNSIYLSWTPDASADTTHVRRKAGSYPTSITDGLFVCNKSGGSFNDTGISSAVHYYYRAWTWNGEEISTGYAQGDNRTSPGPPTGLIGTVSGNTLTINWTKGSGAVRTVLKNDTSSYPLITSGYLVANTTNNTWIRNGLTDINYHRAWSWATVDGVELFSKGTNLLYGGLEINVYKEDEAHIEIGNYTVFVTDGSETYQNTSCNNPFRIDVGSIPNGEDIIVQVSKTGYNTRSQTMDLFENNWYQVNFYLAADDEGSPDGEEGDDWYVNDSDPNNETFASHYIITVKNNVEESVENAYVVIKRYINTSNSYENVLSDYSDSSGQVEVDLIPDTVYQVIISKTGYNTMTTFWTPSEISYVEDAYKTFVITPVDEEYQNETSVGSCISFTGGKNSTHGFVNFSNSGTYCGSVSNFTIWIYEINTVTNVTSYYTSYVDSSNQSYNLSFIMNTSNNYLCKIFINHTIFGNFWDSVFIINYMAPGNTSTDEIDSFFTNIFGDNSLGWSGLVGIFVLLAMLFSFGQRSIGIGISLAGFVMLGVNVAFGLEWLDSSICILIILFGILTQWKIERSVNG